MTEAMPGYPGFKFGCDPEIFILDQKGKAISPDMIPGTKSEPHKVKHGAIQRDGMAAEINIDPATSFQEFNRNLNSVLNHLKKMIPDGCELSSTASVLFEPDVWEAAPTEGKMLGCMPDFNAWTGELNPPPAPPMETLRCAGGHLHVGWTDNADMDDRQHIMNCLDLVKQFDWYLAGWSLSQDGDQWRRQMYGKAGACRIKPYGVEYRVLSNFWLKNTETRMQVWNRMQHAIKGMNNFFLPERGLGLNPVLIESINKGVMRPKLNKIGFPFTNSDPAFNSYF